MKILTLLLMLIMATAAKAGGDYFPIIITKFDSDDDEFRFTAEASPEREWMDRSCKEISVTGSFDSVKWALYKAPMSKENHMAAVEYLKMASKTKVQVYFGYIGYGLKPNSSCAYQSKGLILENHKTAYVLSVHDSI